MGSAQIQRDANGRYRKGQTGNPNGRPRRSADFLRTIPRLVSDTTWARIIEKTINDALAGDHYARRFLAERLLGTSTIGDLQPGADDTDGRIFDVVAGFTASELQRLLTHLQTGEPADVAELARMFLTLPDKALAPLRELFNVLVHAGRFPAPKPKRRKSRVRR